MGFFRPADDAYYYYDLAQAVWEGQGLSTDGLHMTNGFHPLWFLVLLPLGGIGAPANDFLPATAQVLSMLLLCAAIGLTVESGRRISVSTLSALIGGLSLWFAPWRGIASAGLEGALALGLIAAAVLIAVGAATRPTKPSTFISLGLVSGAAVLARLDAVFVVGSLLLAVAIHHTKANQLTVRTAKSLALLFIPPVTLIGVYLFVNTWFFGSPMPITASLKSGFPNLATPLETMRDFLAYFVAAIPPWLATLILRARRNPATDVLLGLATGSTVFAAYIALFGQGIFWWHFVSMMIPAAVGLAVTADFLLASRPFQKSAVLRVLLITSFAAIVTVPLISSLTEKTPDGARVAESGWRLEMKRAGEWASRNLAPGSKLGMKDSGAFGYYTGLPVMNLDGVVSDRAFNESLCDGSAFETAARDGVVFVVHHAVESDYTRFELKLPCWDRGTTPSVFGFEPGDEVYRGEPYWHNGADRRTIIWRFGPE